MYAAPAVKGLKTIIVVLSDERVNKQSIFSQSGKQIVVVAF